MEQGYNWQKKLKMGALLFLCQATYGQSFTVKGTIAGKDTGYVTLSYFRDESNKRKTDTVPIKNGRFEFSGAVTGADFAQLYTDATSLSERRKYGTPLFIEPGIITITFINGDADKAVIKGSKSQDEYETLKTSTSKENAEMNRLSASYNSIEDLIKKGLIDPTKADREIKEIDKIYYPFVRAKSNKELLFIKSNPESYVSLLMLYTFVGRLSNDSIDLLYNSISDKIKGSTLDFSFLAYNSRYRKAIAQEYPFDKLVVNETTPRFVIYNSYLGDSTTNDYFKGKVVILEFWGLYCYPCLKANPYIEEIRKQYGNDKVVVIAINNNSDQDMPELISYITRNKFSDWIHVSGESDIKQPDKLIHRGNFSNYSGLGVPRTAIIDPDGKLVYKNLGYSEKDIQNVKLIIKKLLAVM